ncbi:glycosyltransferase [candidate division KSB1 bacterium]|nr:glycosyltransferase [candidate division KSB1 bacterium]
MLSLHLNPTHFETLLISGAPAAGEKSRIADLQQKGIRVATIQEMTRALNPGRDLRALLALYRLIKREQPQIVHTHTAKAGALGRLAAWFAGVPIIVHTFHGHVFQNYFSPIKTYCFILFERLLAKISTRIIVISRSQFTDITEKYRIARTEQVVLIPLGLELERFLNLQFNTRLKSELNLPPTTRLIGMVGRLAPIKNHEMLLQVIAQLHDWNYKVHLGVIGDGELAPQLQRSVQHKALEGYVHFLGWRLDIENIYAGIDLLALTSLNEGTPISIIEAMASGVPVVATQVGGVSDVVTDEVTGLLNAVNAVTQMAQQIKRLLDDQPLRTRLTQAARATVAKTYPYQRLIQDVENLYTQLLPVRD